MAKRLKRELVAEGDMTPMIDMTFQLIAFFMVLLNFVEADQNERIHLPSSELAKPPDAPMVSPITLQVTSEGTVLVGGDEVAASGVAAVLAKESQLLERNDKKPADATVIIRGDARVPTGVVQDLIKTCQESGFENFVLRARQEEERG